MGAHFCTRQITDPPQPCNAGKTNQRVVSWYVLQCTHPQLFKPLTQTSYFVAGVTERPTLALCQTSNSNRTWFERKWLYT